MSNYTLSVLATLLCLALGAGASASVAFLALSDYAMVLASFIGISAFPVGLYLAYLSYGEWQLKYGKTKQ